MGCAVQQEPAASDPKSTATLNAGKSLIVQSNQCSLKSSSESNSTDGSSNSLKKAHSALVKILESAPLKCSNLSKIDGNGGSAGASSASNSNNNQVVGVSNEVSKVCGFKSADSGRPSNQIESPPTVKMKSTPKIDFCPWKKTTIAKEWISACDQELQKHALESSAQSKPTNQPQQQEEEGCNSLSAISNNQHPHNPCCRSRESSQSSDHSSLSASPEPISDDSCSNCSSNSSSDCCSDYLINDLCKQFEENLCEDHVRSMSHISRLVSFLYCVLFFPPIALSGTTSQPSIYFSFFFLPFTGILQALDSAENPVSPLH